MGDEVDEQIEEEKLDEKPKADERKEDVDTEKEALMMKDTEL